MNSFRFFTPLMAWLAAAASASGAEGEAGVEAASPDSLSLPVRVYEFIAHPVLQAATWPVQNVLAPAVEFVTYPTQPPIRYFLDENVIDRAADLFRFGTRSEVSAYPTLSLASGTASRTGATLRHDSPFGRDSERLVGYFSYYVNGDYRIRTFLTAHEFLGGPPEAKFAFALNRFRNAVFQQPDVNLPYAYSQESESYEARLDWPVPLDFRLRTGFSLNNSRFGDGPPPLQGQGPNVLSSGFFRSGDTLDGSVRGFNQSFLDRVWQVGLFRDTRNNENIPLDGSRLETGWYFHDADRDHRFHEWRGFYTLYFKLGSGVYEITPEEERERGSVTLDQFLRRIEYQRLRQQFFLRKVLVVHFVAGQSFELPGNRMPMYGLQSLGNGTPLRAYSGSRYRHYAVAAASAEYRFPILRIMDGMIFNEYGLFGRSLDALDPADNLRNSWGFGVRVRQPDMFLFRIEMAFHGLSGMVLNVNSDTPF